MSAWTSLRDNVKSRIAVVILGLLFWVVFGTGVLVALIAQLVGIVIYLFTGNIAIRDWVTLTGQGTDALNNAAWFKGDWRETISSHTGRWYAAKYGDTYVQPPMTATQPDLVIPPKFKFVFWLTSLFEKDHPLKAVESAAVREGLPL